MYSLRIHLVIQQHGSIPTTYNNSFLVEGAEEEGGSRSLMLDIETGEEIWKTEPRYRVGGINIYIHT